MELHRNFSVEKLKRMGQDLYRDKKYADALEVFDAAIKASGSEDLKLLDNRAATHEKLGDLQAALRDGDRMLRLDKTYLEGYLRTARLLQKLEKPDTALKIYERGLKHVPAATEHYEVMKTFHGKLLRTLCPPTAVDPFVVLPMEMILMILQYLSFPQRCHLLGVSKTWRKLLVSWPAMWKDLDFASSKARKPVTVQAIFNYMARSEYGVTRFTIKGLDLQGSKLLTELAVRCKNLSALELHSGGTLRMSLVNATARARNLKHIWLGRAVPVELASIQKIYSTCQFLTTARFDLVSTRNGVVSSHVTASKLQDVLAHYESRPETDGFTMAVGSICPESGPMRKLHLSSSKAIEDRFTLWKQPINILPHLEDVAFENVLLNEESHLRELNDRFAGRYQLPTTIRKLRLVNTRSFSLVVDNRLLRLDTSLNYPLLSEIEITDWSRHSIQPTNFQSLLECGEGCEDVSQITKLDLSVDNFEKDDILALVATKRLEGVRHLRLRGCPIFDDSLAADVGDTLKGLRSLDIKACKVTGVGLKSLVTGLPHLGSVNFDQCEGLSGDAIEWARAQGVRMAYQTFVD